MRRASDPTPAEQSPGYTETPAEQPYTELRLRARIGDREEFTFVTVDGVRSPDAFRPPELGLLEVLADDPPRSLLVPDANYGVVGTVMAAFADRVRMTETSARAARLCRRNAARNRVADRCSVAITADLRALPGAFGAAALAPTAYAPCAVVEQRLADALAALAPGGEVYLAAAEGAGLARYRRALRTLCGDADVIDDRGDCAVVRGERPPDFDPPRYAEPRTIRPVVDGTELALVTYPGLFSASGLDDGTRALARSLDVADGERVLDLACGYGPLGVYAALTADCAVALTDDDRVATACARRSAARSDVDAVEVATADGVAAVRGRTFDRVVCNPPTHAGRGVLDALATGARDVLADGGRLDLVHHRDVDLGRHLDPAFDRVVATARGDYRLVTARP